MHTWLLYSKQGHIRVSNDERYQLVCHKCGKKLVLRNGQYGEFYSCPGYKEGCKFTFKKQYIDAFLCCIRAYFNNPNVATMIGEVVFKNGELDIKISNRPELYMK